MHRAFRPEPEPVPEPVPESISGFGHGHGLGLGYRTAANARVSACLTSAMRVSDSFPPPAASRT